MPPEYGLQPTKSFPNAPARRKSKGQQREWELIDGNAITLIVRLRGVLPMAAKHVINGVQVVPMGMANAFLIEGH